jgi:hypothetical protein
MENKMKYELTFGQVWKTLSSVNVNEKTDKKMNLTYLSWAWAWGILMEHYPFATYTFDEETTSSNGTVMTNCTLTIGNLERSMFLPVMDYKNNSIANPTSRQVSDTRMRCLVKCMAMFGLGHYIYAGEELPDSKVDEAEAKVAPVETKKFNFEKTGGETLSTNDIEDYLLILASNLKDPENVLHKKSFATNKANIQVALASTSEDDTNNTRLKKLISLYEVA